MRMTRLKMLNAMVAYECVDTLLFVPIASLLFLSQLDGVRKANDRMLGYVVDQREGERCWRCFIPAKNNRQARVAPLFR